MAGSSSKNNPDKPKKDNSNKVKVVLSHSNDLPALKKKAIKALVYLAVALFVYLVGYFEYSFIVFVLIPVVIVVLDNNRRKERQKQVGEKN